MLNNVFKELENNSQAVLVFCHTHWFHYFSETLNVLLLYLYTV